MPNISAIDYTDAQMTGALSKEDILALLQTTPPLVENLCDIQQQVQTNGIDLTVKEVALFISPGTIDINNKERVLADTSTLAFNTRGELELKSGCYLVTHNEIINLPNDIMALAMPRSSLLRCGVSIHNAIWDAGYSGRSRSLMVVYNSYGFRLYRDARIIQLVFFRLSHQVTEGYKGMFQGENV